MVLGHQKSTRKSFFLVLQREQKSHLDGEHGDAFRAVYAVPDAEVSPVLGDHYVTPRHPLDVGAETQDCGLYTALDVVQVKLRRKEKKEAFI